MSIQVNNINVIDDDRNIISLGIATVGSGSSSTIFDGTTGVVNVGTGITMEGIPGNISISGTITAAGFNLPLSVSSFNPTDGATGVAYDSNITITFNQAVGIATTGSITLETSSGQFIKEIGVSDIRSTTNGIIIEPKTILPFSTSIVPIIPSGFVVGTGDSWAGINTTGADTYSFEIESAPLGDSFGSGFLICASAGTTWIVAPSSTQRRCAWHTRDGARAAAQSLTGCTDWFIPAQGQLQNPGFACRTYWDSYVSSPTACSLYWSNTYSPSGNPQAVMVCFVTGAANTRQLCDNCQAYVRAFRCVTY